MGKSAEKKFDESCMQLLKKMQAFEKSYFCNRCNASACAHLREEMNKKFKKEIGENDRLVISLAQSVFKQVPRDSFSGPAF